MTTPLAIALGDPTGIGPEVTLRALAQGVGGTDSRYVVLGDTEGCLRLNAELHTSIPFRPWSGPASDGRYFLLNTCPGKFPSNLDPGAPEAAACAMAALTEGAERCLSGEFAGLVTAPVNKEAIVRAGHSSFVGQTEYLSGLARSERTVMMLLGRDDRARWLRVALATTHVSIRNVPDQVTREKVQLAIELAARACGDLGLPRARVAVCGLNPHAGEGGHLGLEEQTTIAPAVAEMVSRGYNVSGPMSADALFYYVYRGDYDAVVAMYHDQGLAPLKMVAFEHGINWTLGLPFIRTSPDHGTAYDIARLRQANPSSMIAAIQLAQQLAQRKQNV